LIADKKSLNEKCESLVLEMKKSEEHHTNTLKAVEERHSIELQRAREMHAAAEKLHRKRWIDNKTQRIKVTLNISVFNMTKILHVYKYRYFC
jgi:hypothetical protein